MQVDESELEIIQAENAESPLFLSKQKIVGKRLILGTRQWSDRVPDSTLEDCLLDIVNPNAVSMGGSRMIRCVVKPRVKVNTVWNGVYWEGCEFHGNYLSTHFGNPSERVPIPSDGIFVRDCNFTAATMHYCAIFNSLVETLLFPSWPCFTILNPIPNWQAWKNCALPFTYRIYGESPEQGPDAYVFHWPTILHDAKEMFRKHAIAVWREVVEADEEEVRRALSKLPFVIM